MNKRVYKVQLALLREIDKYSELLSEREASSDWEKLHLSSVSRIGTLLALKRGIDKDLAAISCTCHDYGRIITGKEENHAENGYPKVKDFLEKLDVLSSEELETVAIAVKNHSKKGEVGSPLEELVKDADIIDLYLYEIPLKREDQIKRLENLLEEGVLTNIL
ncbi:MAG: HD domain-containing protein [Anaerovoracaceae bacterium]